MEPLDENNSIIVTFPKSSEDHRLQLVSINGAFFAIVHAPLESDGPIRLHCEEWSLILLAPIKSKEDIVISAINIICLGEIASEGGNINIHASNQLVKLVDLIKPEEKVCQMGESGEFQLDDNPGFFLYYYRLLDDIVNHVRLGDPSLIYEAQKQVIACLCTLADKMVGKSKNLSLQKVLDIWNIPRKA